MLKTMMDGMNVELEYHCAINCVPGSFEPSARAAGARSDPNAKLPPPRQPRRHHRRVIIPTGLSFPGY